MVQVSKKYRRIYGKHIQKISIIIKKKQNNRQKNTKVFNFRRKSIKNNPWPGGLAWYDSTLGKMSDALGVSKMVVTADSNSAPVTISYSL